MCPEANLVSLEVDTHEEVLVSSSRKLVRD